MFILSINRPKRFGSFENRDRRLMTELIPHLLRAHRIGQTVQDLQLVQGLQASALDQTTAPVLGLGRNARLLYTNKAADIFRLCAQPNNNPYCAPCTGPRRSEWKSVVAPTII